MAEYLDSHELLVKVFWCYIAVISLISVIAVIYDKIAAAKLPAHRVREASLLWLSAFGGSAAMLLTMLIIRHKTQHLKFMIGIPIIMIIQIIAVFAFLLINSQ